MSFYLKEVYFMKKTFTFLIAWVLAFTMMAMPVSASEYVDNREDTYVDSSVRAGSSYFTKGISTMNALNYGSSPHYNVTSGSCLGTTRSITKVTFYGVLSSGSSSCKVYIISPSGTVAYITMSSTGTLTYYDFNGEDPYGTWTVYIVTNGIVSTVKSGSLKVYYNYAP